MNTQTSEPIAHAVSPVQTSPAAAADVLQGLRSNILRAAADRAPLRIRGGGSKDF